MNYYAVRKGRTIGVFNTWEEIAPLVNGYPGASFKKFGTPEEAQKFIQNNENSTIGVKQFKISHYLEKKSDNPTTNSSLMTVKKLIKLKTEDISKQVITSENIDFKDKVDKTDKVGEIAKKKAQTINVYCDGSTFNNGKKYAAGGIGISFGKNNTKNVSEPYLLGIPTNQKTELYALICTLKILEQIIETDPNTIYEFHIYTDSRYVIDCITKWLPGWMKNNWIKVDGEKVKNIDLLKELSAIYNRHRRQYKIYWVGAHGKSTGVHADGNADADELAKNGSYQHPNYRNKSTSPNTNGNELSKKAIMAKKNKI